ncbi:NAD(P)/FAD-dependent oxidoreductase [Amycolatopsis jejuensis]|uniref:NAD(P)/FAD-dependent oxidoreductase n=1 Tax=Amycolatopsis jejuensis TaxID=330084 RepID=UPI000526E812|nr:FAD-dependent oxidoreductase [Amycolatopsis jejuensis]
MGIDRVVVAGGGLAALRAAECLRAEGYDGSLVMLSEETVAPYDRPPLSKQVLTGETEAASTVLRTPQFYEDNAIELRLGTPARRLDLRARRVHTTDDTLPFDALVLATGSKAQALPTGGELPGVHTLRTVEDARAIRRELMTGPRVVVVGAGFIGAEVASSARALGLDTTVIEGAPAPLGRSVGTEMGSLLGNLHRRHGTVLSCGVGVAELHGAQRVEAVELTDGRRLPADLVVVGIGARPATGWLADSGLRIGDGVVCDATLCAGPPGVYAAGDLARWPNPLFDEPMRCEQWTNAVEQGRHVARNILAGAAGARPFAGSNYFWSDQYGIRIQYAGITGADEVRTVAGSVDSSRFLALYRRDRHVVGALALDSAKQLVRAKTQIERRASWDDALSSLAAGSADPAARK